MISTLRALTILSSLFIATTAWATQPPGPCGWEFDFATQERPRVTTEVGAPIVLPGRFSNEWNCSDRDVDTVVWTLTDAAEQVIPGRHIASAQGDGVVMWHPEQELTPGAYKLSIRYAYGVPYFEDPLTESTTTLDVTVTAPRGLELVRGLRQSYSFSRRVEQGCCPGHGMELCGDVACHYRGISISAQWQGPDELEDVDQNPLRYTLEVMHPSLNMSDNTLPVTQNFRVTQGELNMEHNFRVQEGHDESCARLIVSRDHDLRTLAITPWHCEDIPSTIPLCVIEEPFMCPGNEEPIPRGEVDPGVPPRRPVIEPEPENVQIRASGCGGCTHSPATPVHGFGALVALGFAVLVRREKKLF